MLMVGNNNLGKDREVLVASLIFLHKLNYGEIIANEIKIWATKPNAYPFPRIVI